MKRSAFVSILALGVGFAIGVIGFGSAQTFAGLDGPCDPTSLPDCNADGTRNCTQCPARPKNCKNPQLAWCCPVDGQSTRRCDCAESQPTNCISG